MMVRQADEGDISSLAYVAKTSYADEFGQSFTEQDLAGELERNRSERYFRDAITTQTILLATVEDRVVGYVQFGALQMTVHGATDRDKALNRLYILPELQGKGLGSALLDAALRHPLLADADRVYLDVWDENSRSATTVRTK